MKYEIMKYDIVKYKIIILILFVFTNFNFKLYEEYDSAKIIKSVQSDRFKTFFRLCDKKTDTIIVYNNLKNILNDTVIKISCNKIIIFKDSNINIDFNSSIIGEDKIVLYKYVKVKNQFKLSFLNIRSNSNLTLIFNNNSKFIGFESGTF